MRSESQDRAGRLVVFGDPRSRRIGLLCEAARNRGLTPHVVPYLDVLAGRPWWTGLARDAAAGDVLLRLESPGECPLTARAVLQAGIGPMERRGLRPWSAARIAETPFDRGEIVRPLQWFLGFEQAVRRLESEARAELGHGLQWMNTPGAVLTAFDKRACLRKWSDAGLPTPPGHEGIASYDHLRSALPGRHGRLFVKLRYGFSAMGAVALEWRGDRVRAITTVEVAGAADRRRMFVSKRPRLLRGEAEIAALVDALAAEEIVVEDWLPKARRRGKPFDVRIVTIGGRARHAVGRASSSPFTNLNLDAERIDRAELAELLGEGWTAAVSLAERAARSIDGAGYLGMDILVRPCRRRCVVLEANAFGDYLPGLICRGESTYAAELRLLAPEGALL